ncbi:MAG: RnfABCDGE type electron transport complex subunit G [Endomicrobia bacterium]|nr:RnfABCDGE type electron transport complex subunit G [Endomicrobiia bacterium]MDW8055249.1 RnfABCDGE type electron transport complex subunit G [Elusimicrobiota bacterium]
MNNTLRMVLVLVLVCIVSALSLSFLYVKTQPRIEENKILKEVKIKQELIPEAEKFVIKSLGDNLSVEQCYDKNAKLLGLIVNSYCQGYAGKIEYLVAVTTYTPISIKSVKILSHKETPGLGANVTKQKFLMQFVGKTGDKLWLKKEKTNGEIDSITGATITSRAITNSLREMLKNNKLEEFIEKLENKSVLSKPKGEHTTQTIQQQPQEFYSVE